MQLRNWQAYLTITFTLLGILLSTQIQTQNRLASDLSSQKTSDLTIMVKNLSDKRLSLTHEISEAEDNVLAYETDYADEAEILSRIHNELTRLELIIGLSDVTGPGIEISVGKENLLYGDIISIINELWAAGAEAISINNVRVTNKTYFGYTEALNSTYITCNDQILATPYIITAIGDAQTLEKGLTLPGGIIDNLAFFRIFPKISIKETVTVPSSTQHTKLHYAKPNLNASS